VRVLGAEDLRDDDGAASEIENWIDEAEDQTRSLSAIIAEP
jgi:hypothetical protein